VFACAHTDGAVRVFMTNKKVERMKSKEKITTRVVTKLVWSPTTQFLAALAGRDLILLRVEKKKLVKVVLEDLSSDGTFTDIDFGCIGADL
jgi:hypothetical protein